MRHKPHMAVVAFALAIAIGGGVACAKTSDSTRRNTQPGSAQKTPRASLEIPDGGSPGSTYEISVPCSTKPEVLVRDLQAGPPQATLVPQSGTETRPGLWAYDIQAGDVDQKVMSKCGSAAEAHRYDVDEPALFPGPTYDTFSDWRPKSVTMVVGTDCPAGTKASMSLSGASGYTQTMNAPIDEFGNWEAAIPESAPAGDITATAACGDVTYDPLEIPATARP